MAMFLDSTPAPVVQTGLLPFVFRPVPPVDDPRSAVELLEEIRRAIDGQAACHGDTPIPELPPESLLLPPAPLAALTAAFAQRRAIFGPLELREDRIKADGYLAEDLSPAARRVLRTGEVA